MSLKLKQGLRVFVYGEYIDLRSGFDKLSMLVREKMELDWSTAIFLSFWARSAAGAKPSVTTAPV